MRKTLKILLLICSALGPAVAGAGKASAQTGLDDPPPPSTCLPTDPDYDPRECVPIDGGLAILLIAGVGYGFKKYRFSSRNENQSTDSLSR